MKITVRVAVDTGDDNTDPVETEVLALSRDELGPDTLGLHLAEAHELLSAVQETLVATQVADVVDQHRCCLTCGRRLRHKDVKQIRLDTLFGTVTVNSPRYFAAPAKRRTRRRSAR